MTDPIKTEALSRQQMHAHHPTNRPLSDGYELIGLRGEAEFGDVFGCEVDFTRRPAGDGGIDYRINLSVSFKVDIKTARKPANLIVEDGKVEPRTIYVLAGYDDTRDAANLIGWTWGATLLKAPKKDFGHGVISHYVPRADLRSIEELLRRRVKDA